MDSTQSIVLELQHLASDSREDVADLLRKAFMVASKLQLKEAVNWIQKEMKGYESGGDVPEYRKLMGQLRIKNPYHGLQPFMIDDDSIMDAICTLLTTQSVGELSDLVRKHDAGGFLHFNFLPGQLQTLMAMQQQAVGFALEPVRIVAVTQVSGILDAVRSRVLEWSLRLESEGILGYGMTFTSEEKRKAALSGSVTNITTENLTMGDIYSAGQAAAIGPNAHAHDNTFQQIWNQSGKDIDLHALAADLPRLRSAMRKEATSDEHDLALGHVAAAEKAAKVGDGPNVIEHLKNAGKWAFDVATKIGISVASEALKVSMGLR